MVEAISKRRWKFAKNHNRKPTHRAHHKALRTLRKTHKKMQIFVMYPPAGTGNTNNYDIAN